MAEHSIYQDIAERTGGDIYIGVVGPVRTGKSTFINIIADKLSYDEGEILWDDKPIDPMSMNLGYLAEERGQIGRAHV